MIRLFMRVIKCYCPGKMDSLNDKISDKVDY